MSAHTRRHVRFGAVVDDGNGDGAGRERALARGGFRATVKMGRRWIGLVWSHAQLRRLFLATQQPALESIGPRLSFVRGCGHHLIFGPAIQVSGGRRPKHSSFVRRPITTHTRPAADTTSTGAAHDGALRFDKIGVDMAPGFGRRGGRSGASIGRLIDRSIEIELESKPEEGRRSATHCALGGQCARLCFMRARPLLDAGRRL